MKVLLFCALLVCACLGNEEHRQEAKKMRVKELKARLRERGARTDDLLTKDALVDRVVETWDEPVVAAEPEPKKVVDDAEMEQIMRALKKERKQKESLRDKLKSQGIDTSNMHFMDDSDNIEQLIADLEKKKKQKDKKEEL